MLTTEKSGTRLRISRKGRNAPDVRSSIYVSEQFHLINI